MRLSYYVIQSDWEHRSYLKAIVGKAGIAVTVAPEVKDLDQYKALEEEKDAYPILVNVCAFSCVSVLVMLGSEEAMLHDSSDYPQYQSVFGEVMECEDLLSLEVSQCLLTAVYSLVMLVRMLGTF